jgi:hypothetical protein
MKQFKIRFKLNLKRFKNSVLKTGLKIRLSNQIIQSIKYDHL